MVNKADDADVVIVKDYHEYFTKSQGQAKLVYCDDDDKDAVIAAAKNCCPNIAVKENGVTRKELHGNDEKNLLIVTEERLMRGFDYRAPTTGFALLIAKQLPNKRAYLQALGRVGRMGEDASWYKLSNVGIPQNIATAHGGRILAHYIAQSAPSSKKKNKA